VKAKKTITVPALLKPWCLLCGRWIFRWLWESGLSSSGSGSESHWSEVGFCSPATCRVRDRYWRSSLGRNGHWQSPRRKVFYNHYAVNHTLDTGAETSMIKPSIAKQIGATIRKAKQTALRADGVTPFNVIGEIHFDVSRNSHTYSYIHSISMPLLLCPCCKGRATCGYQRHLS
jgi:hypothetical protein